MPQLHVTRWPLVIPDVVVEVVAEVDVLDLESKLGHGRTRYVRHLRHRASVARSSPFRPDRHRSIGAETWLTPYAAVRMFATDQARNA
jgi:hypothetical protein